MVLAKAVLEQAGPADYDDVVCAHGVSTITPCARACRSSALPKRMWPMRWPGRVKREQPACGAGHQCRGVGSAL